MNDEKKRTRVLCEVRFTRKSKIIEEFWGPLCQNRGERKHAPTNFTKCGGDMMPAADEGLAMVSSRRATGQGKGRTENGTVQLEKGCST